MVDEWHFGCKKWGTDRRRNGSVDIAGNAPFLYPSSPSLRSRDESRTPFAPVLRLIIFIARRTHLGKVQ